MLKILLVDDEPSIRLAAGDGLRADGHEVIEASDGKEALLHLGKAPFDLVITDVRMPKLDGMSLFRRIRSDWPHTDVIIMTAYGEVDAAVRALQSGAQDYLTKPFDSTELRVRVKRLDARRALDRELRSAREELAARQAHSQIIGQSRPMLALRQRIDTIAPSDASVVVVGESGTGKELVARSLHAASSRSDGPFVAVNCAAFPETLIEAELFGHEKGAFTGAARRRQGRFMAAHGGTLFLDEIGEIPVMVQVKLLRVLQESVIEPLGSNTPQEVDARLVCATHRNLKEMIAAGTFREDLYYRINVLEIRVPPLRERRGDLPLLVEHFLSRYSKRTPPPAISPKAWAALSNYAFPGNVRELEHAIQHAVVLSGGQEIDLHHLPPDLSGTVHEDSEHTPRPSIQPLNDAAREFERQYILRALSQFDGKRVRTAEALGISRKNLWEKLKGHGITDSDLDD